MIEWHYQPIEVAKLLDVDAEQVLGWIHDGEIIASDVAKKGSKRPRWRIAESEMCKFLVRRSNQKEYERRKQERINAFLNP